MSHTRFVLLLGFGGLLALMALAGFGAVQVLHRIEGSNDEIRRDFLARNNALLEIRSDLYLSGTYLRDYVLDPDPAAAAGHLAALNRVRDHIATHLRDYERGLRPEEADAFHGLRDEIGNYWRAMDPVFRWSAVERRQRGFAFLRDEVFPRRASIFEIAGHIAEINEQQLDAGARRIADLFTGFTNRLLITVAVTLGLGLLLAAFAIRTTLRLEKEASDRYHEVVLAREELKDLSARLVEAQENERRAISRELHDEVGQSLSAVLVELGNLSASLPGGRTEELRGHVSVIRKLAENCVAVVRNMALLLRPSMLDDFGLVPALQWQAREVSKRTGIHVNVADEHVPEDLPEQYKTCIYRVVQEALHNCSRHAGASTVRISVREEDGNLLLSIQDDGKGFDHKREKGLGLLGMQERVEHLGGSFRVESAPNSGVLIAVSLPPAGAPSTTVGAR